MSGQPCIDLASAITFQQKEAAVDSGVVLLDTAIPPFVIFVTEGNLEFPIDSQVSYVVLLSSCFVTGMQEFKNIALLGTFDAATLLTIGN